MPAIDEIHSQFFGQGIAPVRTFSCDKCVDPSRRYLLDFTACTTGDQANFRYLRRALRDTDAASDRVSSLGKPSIDRGFHATCLEAQS